MGARAARDNDVSVNFNAGCPYAGLPGEGTFQLHLVTDAINGTAFYDGTTDVELSHLFVYVSLKIKGEPGPHGGPTTITNPQLSTVEKALIEVAERWDQAHPAYTGGGARKNYAIAPKAGVNAAGTRVIKLRHFVSPFQPPPLPHAHVEATPTPALTITAKLGNDRSSVAGSAMKYYLGPPLHGGSVSCDPDGTVADEFTLAHEFGHVFGLPDEYIEPCNVKALTPDPDPSDQSWDPAADATIQPVAERKASRSPGIPAR